MAINGRINVDVLFHDTDGTTSLKVVSLEDSTEYTTGKVAIVTGTCGTTAVAIVPSDYKNAAGESVSFNQGALRLAFSASPGAVFDTAQNPSAGGGDNSLFAQNGRITVIEDSDVSNVYTTAGTASYTIVFYGT